MQVYFPMVLIYTVPPKLKGTNGTVYVMEGSSSIKTLHYEEVYNLPPPHSFTWKRNNIPFHGNAHVQLLNGNRTLSISRASRADEGNYKLTVVSESGEDCLDVDLYVTCK